MSKLPNLQTKQRKTKIINNMIHNYYSILLNVQHILFLLIVVSFIGVNGSTTTTSRTTTGGTSTLSCTGFVSSTFLQKNKMSHYNLQQQVSTLHKSNIRQQHAFIVNRQRKAIIARAATESVTTFNNQEKNNDSELTSTTTSTSTVQQNTIIIQIIVTRELGKNTKLQKAIETTIINAYDNKDDSVQIKVIELPCIEHATGVDYNKLSSTIQTQYYDYIIITSPEAARVLIDVWPYFSSTNSSENTAATNNKVHIPIIAAVGTATEQVLTNAGLSVGFVPSKATGTTLVKELPFICKTNESDNDSNNNDTNDNICNVLYPASARAEDTIQNGLQHNRNDDGKFQVTRLNTYDTITSIWTKEQQQQLLLRNDDNDNIHTIVTFASPSSIKGWMLNTNNTTTTTKNVIVACIGETSANACINKYNFNSENIFYPLHQPGIDGWINSIQDAITTIIERKKKQ